MSSSGYKHLSGCNIIKITDKAILVEIPSDVDEWEREWIPRSQIAEHGDNFEEGDIDVTVSITEYIARQKGLEDLCD